ncbi:hypothetical protein [Cognatishimia maritima]|uniref:Ferrochelatase n=1 Tax=Cognatishimia maritima TaxID=870908 RepID=A0A1M5IZT6_9RHOB|nr:hypothetical protein [Cognatishimia maritima]SHG33824.1 hypothetical protein SAMN04488044_0500 [Cognatishimia maritima]
MKKALLALAIATATTPAMAGGMSEPMVEAPVIEADAASSANEAATVMAILTIAILAAALDN